MSSYPLDEPHLEALLYVCKLPADERWIVSQWPIVTDADRACRDAIKALFSPTSAASLVRDLLARAGKPALLVNTSGVLEPAWPVRIYYMASDVPDVDPDDEDDDRCFEVSEADVPRLISALASLAPGDRDGAMRALSEVGR